MKKLVWAFPLLTLPLLMAAGVPVPYTWYRAGPVTLGAYIYHSDIVRNQHATNPPTPIQHQITDYTVTDPGGVILLPPNSYPGRIVIFINSTSDDVSYCPPLGESINRNGLFGCVVNNDGMTRCVKSTTTKWICQ